MPVTTLTEKEWSKIGEVASFITKGLWSNYFKDPESLSRDEFNVVRRAGELIFGSRPLFYQFTSGDTAFSKND